MRRWPAWPGARRAQIQPSGTSPSGRAGWDYTSFPSGRRIPRFHPFHHMAVLNVSTGPLLLPKDQRIDCRQLLRHSAHSFERQQRMFQVVKNAHEQNDVEAANRLRRELIDVHLPVFHVRFQRGMDLAKSRIVPGSRLPGRPLPGAPSRSCTSRPALKYLEDCGRPEDHLVWDIARLLWRNPSTVQTPAICLPSGRSKLCHQPLASNARFQFRT